ncbi:uncharacterized protein [Oscarella lobularis]|uniref:uncharacterized protein n=1 Tax=Oscarella lobularis TaxID=121494 RepID=UPI0033136261
MGEFVARRGLAPPKKVSSEISALLETPDYAEIFGALVSRTVSCDAIVAWAKVNASDLSTRCDDDLDAYLRREEAATRERIRAYAEQQEALLKLRKSQVARTKAVLTRLAGEIASGSYETESTTDDRRNGGADEVSSSAADDEDLFEFDDTSDDRSSNSLCTPAPELGTSLPISMPGTNNWRLKNGVEDEKTCEFENIGESMKKLALSVHASSTKMFGDLPRPRVNSDAVRKFPRK